MSAFRPVPSASPLSADVHGDAPIRLVLTRLGHRHWIHAVSLAYGSVTRFCGQLPEPDHHAGDAYHGQEGLGGFVVARGDAAEVFDFVDEAFDQMAFLVELGIVSDDPSARAVGGDNGDRAALHQVRPEGIGVEGLVGDQDFHGQPVEQRFGLRHFVALAGSEADAQRVAEAIDSDVQLGAQPAARPPDGLILSPPFAPAEC